MTQARNLPSKTYNHGAADAIAENINVSYLRSSQQSRCHLKRRIQEAGS